MFRTIQKYFKIATLLFISAMILSACTEEKEAERTTETTSTAAIADPIKTESGMISGTVMGEGDEAVRVYRGIPYAAPPVGNLRWKPPQPVQPWTGVRECTTYSDIAPQRSMMMGMDESSTMSEDCLYLNVNTPAKKSGDLLPVMVWLHGGALETGSGNDAASNQTDRNRKGVVSVMVNHRLGVFGYMAHPQLSKESEHGVSGNYGTLDLIAALQWVKRNIEAFGGDPNRVLIHGSSGGGTKVVSLMASPLAKGLFQRAVIESGSGAFNEPADNVHTKPLKDTEALGAQLAAALKVDKETDVLAAMRAKSADEIINAASNTKTFGSGSLGYLSVDGYVLPDQVISIFQSGKQNNVPLMLGASIAEKTEYTPISIGASAVENANSKAYIYVLNHVPLNLRKQGQVAGHAMISNFVFGDLEGIRAFGGMPSGPDSGPSQSQTKPSATDAAPESLNPQTKAPEDSGPLIDEIDRRVSDDVMSMWVQFAATGDPNVAGLVSWPAYDPATPQYLEIKDPLEVKPWSESAFAE